MKKLFLLVSILSIFITGCIKRDTMEDIKIYTTIYPIEFITNRLYSEYSTIESIYPKGVNIQLENCNDCKLYTLTDKQISDYSKGDLFIFNSLLYESNYVRPMLEQNKNLKIINATDHLSITDYYGLEELWLDPSRLKTLARNIKNGFDEYIDNYYLKNKIEENFEILKEDLDKLESRISEMIKKSDNKILVTGDEVFEFLSKEKYGLTIYTINEETNKKTLETVKSLINSKKIKYIYIKQYEDANETLKELIKGTTVELIYINTLVNLTENERNSKKDYFMIMNENIELLKKGLYN